jgi:hypothetical protein
MYHRDSLVHPIVSLLLYDRKLDRFFPFSATSVSFSHCHDGLTHYLRHYPDTRALRHPSAVLYVCLSRGPGEPVSQLAGLTGIRCLSPLVLSRMRSLFLLSFTLLFRCNNVCSF